MAAAPVLAPVAAGVAERRRLAPSTPLLVLAVAVFVLACLAPVGGRTAATFVALAGLAAALLVLLSLADAWLALRPGARFEVAPADAGERDSRLLRCTVGRPRALRLRLTRAAAAERPVPLTLACSASDAGLERCITLPAAPLHLNLTPGAAWACEVELQPCARGEVRGLRLGLETPSPLRLWRRQQWSALDLALRVYPDLRPARRELLRSPVCRALFAAARLPAIGQGREFERLREYQSGDLYSDIAWKATARRRFPVTRLYQWEREQEVVLVVDHSRLAGDGLECAIATALAAADAALAAGDRIGLITFADEVTGWLAPRPGPSQVAACRDRLARLAPSRAQPSYDVLFSAIRTRLRRRAYLLLLAGLTEPALAEPFCEAARLVTALHLVAAQSVLPAGVTPMFHGPPAADIDDVYAALAGDLEWQRLGELRRRLARGGVRFRAVPAARYLREAVEGYLEAKREQRL